MVGVKSRTILLWLFHSLYEVSRWTAVKLSVFNTPGTRVGPGYRNQTLSVKSRKTHENQLSIHFFFKCFIWGPLKFLGIIEVGEKPGLAQKVMFCILVICILSEVFPGVMLACDGREGADWLSNYLANANIDPRRNQDWMCRWQIMDNTDLPCRNKLR